MPGRASDFGTEMSSGLERSEIRRPEQKPPERAAIAGGVRMLERGTVDHPAPLNLDFTEESLASHMWSFSSFKIYSFFTYFSRRVYTHRVFQRCSSLHQTSTQPMIVSSPGSCPSESTQLPPSAG